MRPASRRQTDIAVIASWPHIVLRKHVGQRGVIRFEAIASNGDAQNRADLTITAQTGEERSVILNRRLAFGTDKHRYAVIFDLPGGATEPRFELTNVSAPVTILSREVITADTTFVFTSATECRVRATDFDRSWRQEGAQLAVTWLGDTYRATMPSGFTLEAVPPERVELAAELLFGEIERAVFGRSRKLLEVSRAESTEEFELEDASKVLLCYSAGEDSTAALELLPPDRTVAYYSERPYDRYKTAAGASISLHTAYERSVVSRVPGLARVPNEFELIGLSVGMSLGYRDSFGYAALAVLMAQHLKCNTIAFGSVMEQIFLRSGCNYSDVVNYRSARLVAYRSLFRDAGLYFSVPTGGLSEVLTHRITRENRHGYVAVPCPSTSASGEPCGTCFKCFRKLRLDDGVAAPDPSPGALKSITARPMKSATSVVAAAQNAGESRFGLAEYSKTDISYLKRYYGEGLRGLVPKDLVAHVERALHDRGIEPMTLLDEYRLRTVAEVFDPGNLSMKAAFPGKQAERFGAYLAQPGAELPQA